MVKMKLVQRFEFFCEHPGGCDAYVTVDLAAGSSLSAMVTAVVEKEAPQWAYDDDDGHGGHVDTGIFLCAVHKNP